MFNKVKLNQLYDFDDSYKHGFMDLPVDMNTGEPDTLWGFVVPSWLTRKPSKKNIILSSIVLFAAL